MRREGARRVLVVAEREITERGRTRAFRISTVVAVLAVVAIVALPSLLAKGPSTYHVGLAGTVAAGTSEALRAQAGTGNATVTTTTYPSAQAGERALRDGDVDVLLVDRTTLEWRHQPDAALAALVAGAERAVQVRDRAAELGLSQQEVAKLLAPIALTQRRLTTTGGLGENGEVVGTITVVLVFIAVGLYGNAVLTGVAQEKSSRVAEVLLARIRPRELLTGKVLGIGVMGLGQFALIAGAAGIATRVTSDPQVPRIPVGTLAWLVVWFVLGYMFYSVVYAALGALTSRVEDAGNVSAPVSVMLVGGYLATLAVLSAPDSATATVLSFLPPTAPFAMPVRITMVGVPVWQLLAAALLTAATVWLLVLGGSRLYTGALLRTGARVPVRVAWRAGAERS